MLRRKYLLLFLIILLLKAIAFTYIGIHALPFADDDFKFFTMGGKSLYYQGRMSAASLSGTWFPNFDKVYAIYPQFYPFLIFCFFTVMGCNIYAYLFGNFILIFVFTILISLMMYKISGDFLAASLFALLDGFILNYLGRPELFTSIALTAALFILTSNIKFRFPLTVFIFCMAAASAPVNTVEAFVIAGFFLYFGYRKNFIKNTITLSISMVVFTSLIFLIFTYPYIGIGLDQFLSNLTISYKTNIVRILILEDRALILLILWEIAFLIVFYAKVMKKLLYKENDDIIFFVKAHIYSFPIIIILQSIIFGRSRYDYIFFACEYFALISLILIKYFRSIENITGKYNWKIVFLTGYIILLGLTAINNRALIQSLALPTIWGNNGVGYSQMEESINSVIPKDAVVGGNCKYMLVLKDGRNFYISSKLVKEKKLDYFINGFDFKGGGLFREENLKFHTDLKDNYDIVYKSPTNFSPMALKIGKISIPLAGKNIKAIDWSYVIYKKKVTF